MNHSFDINVAKEYGVHAAILLQNITFWCLKNKANGANEHDGNYWTYNSKKAFSELFPYMTARQIEYALKRLIDEGVIVTGNYNANAYDRTLWYAVTKKGFSIQQNCGMDATKFANGKTENVEPIPDINANKKQTDIKPDKKESKKAPLKSFDELIDGYTENEELRSALRDYIQMRTAIRKKITNRGLELAFKELDKLGRTDAAKVAIVNQSVLNSWQGLFPLKSNQQGTRNNGGWDERYYRPSESTEPTSRIIGIDGTELEDF